MYLNFRQGLISGSNFILEGPNKWGIQITGKDLQITLCNGPQDILINISNDLSGVFGTIDKTVDQYLYVEVDRRGNYIFGTMPNDYIIGEDEPTDVEEGQWWFNTRNKTLYKKIPNRGFMKTIGCILAEIKGGVVIEYATGVSQVGILGSSNEFRASELLRDVNGQSIHLSDGTYLTKTSNLLTDGVTPLGSIEASNLYGIADEDIPAFSVVRIMDNGNDLPKVELVEYDDVGDSLVGFVKEAAFYGEDVKVSLHGIFMNPDWDLLNGARVGSFVFAGPDNDRGLVVNKDPHSENNLIPRQPPIGRIINKSTILFTTSNNQIIEIEEEIPEPVRPATTGRAGIVKLSKSSANPNDPVVVEENDPRMFDAREPLPHTHAMDEVDFDFDDIDIDFEHGGGTGGASEPSNLEEWIEYLFINKVEFDDPRLNDPRPPLPHLHTARDVNVTGFEDAYGNMQEDTDAQEWIERLFNEKIGKDGGVVDGTLSIMREPEFGTDAVNKAFVDKVLGSAHRTIRITENFENISSGATVETSVDLSNYGIELDGSGVRGILYYKNSSSSSDIPYEVVVSDPIRGRQYTSQGSGEDREPTTVEFTEDVVISVRNEGGVVLGGVSVEVSILILEGIESIQIGIDDLDNIVLDGSNVAITSAILRTLRKTIGVGYGETNAESIVFNTLGNNSTRIVEVDLSLLERELELNDSSNYVVHDSDTKVTSGGFLDVGELQELYDIMCPACVAHRGNRCASNAHESACVAADRVLGDSSSTQGDVDSALLALRNSAFVALTSGSGSVGVRTSSGVNDYAIKYRRLGSDVQFSELKPFNKNDYNTTTNFASAMEIYIVGRSVTQNPSLDFITFQNNSTLDKIVTWGELGTRQFIMQGSTRAFEVPNWLPSSVNNMTSMFHACINFNSANVSMWDTTNNTSLSHTFYLARKFNQNINSWSTDNVTSLVRTFNGASDFNQPLNNWNTSKVTRMDYTFSNSIFNQDISSWNVDRVTNMEAMFYQAKYNQPLNNWNVENVTNMENMFRDSEYNQPLNNWNVGNVTNMRGMFRNSEYNQPLNNWNVENVTNMVTMFYQAKYNQSLNNWNVGNVTDVLNMFTGSSFNRSICNWDVSKMVGDLDFFKNNFGNSAMPNMNGARPLFTFGPPANRPEITKYTGAAMVRTTAGVNIYVYKDDRGGNNIFLYRRGAYSSANYNIYTPRNSFEFPKTWYDGRYEVIYTRGSGGDERTYLRGFVRSGGINGSSLAFDKLTKVTTELGIEVNKWPMDSTVRGNARMAIMVLYMRGGVDGWSNE